jgi:flagellar biogenesis protein FliO
MNNIDSPPLMADFFSMFGSFVLVLLLLGIVLFVLKKLQTTSSVSNGGRKIQILEVMPTSNKQKIMLLKIDDQKILIGVSGQNMNQLGHWNTSNNFSNSVKKNHNEFDISLEDNLISSKKTSSKAHFVNKHSKKLNTMVSEKTDPKVKPSKLDTELEKFSEVSSIKHTENLLSFAKKIRGSLNQSINRAQRNQ